MNEIIDLSDTTKYPASVLADLNYTFALGDDSENFLIFERLNRNISLSRRNSLFFGFHKGAQRAAMFYSMACSCRLNNINFFEFISDVINRAALMQPNTDIAVYRTLMPDKWKAL